MKETYQHEFNWWQRALAQLLGMWRINTDSIDFKWGYFAPRFGFDLMFNRGGYFNQRCSVTICLIWGALNIALPFKTKIPESCDCPRYGIQIHDGTLWLHLGGKMNDWEQCDSKWITWRLPFFTWEFDWRRIQLPGGEWKDYEYEEREDAYTEVHPYSYTLKSGEKQERLATCFVDEMQWHKKWFPFWKMKRRSIEISFNDEVGEGTGSWKGGVTGTSYEMLPGESIKDCLKRMQEHVKFGR